MILEINNSKAGLDEEVTRKVKEMLRFTLARFEGVVTRVVVRFIDVNGPRGGVDKRCRISAKLKTTGQLVVVGEGASPVEALAGCLDRLVRSVRREIDRRQYPRVKNMRRNRKWDDETAGENESMIQEV